MIHRRRLITGGAAFAAASTLARPAIAQAGWPNRPVSIAIPFTPGGGADTIARLVAIKMSEVLGAQFFVESKPGAGGNIAATYVARSAPDGYQMFLAGDHHATNIFLNANLPYHPVTDFEPVSLVVQYPVAMAIPSNSPDKTVADFIARAKARPGELSFGSPGHGAVPHLSAELFTRAAGIKMTHVPYRGAAPGIQDLIPGRIDSFFNNIAPMVPLADQGQMRLLGVTTAKRSPMVPNLPSIGETLPGYDVTGWYALFVPAKTPKEIIQRMYQGVKAAVDDPSIRKKLEDQAMIVVGSTPEELGKFHKAELDKWGPLIKEAGLKQQD
ncbi:MAG: tripartite tricarboxylate transporter substrate binding protein [Pseudomonadota bacterium]